MNKNLTILIAALVVLFGAYFISNNRPASVEPSFAEEVVVYMTRTCGCCEVYVKYMENKGVDTEVVYVDDLNSVKIERNIPFELSSCHTSEVAGYFVEGHIPLEAIEKLLNERPNIAGIALPGMPSGTPGMPGPKTEEWVIYSIGHDGEIGEFMRI